MTHRAVVAFPVGWEEGYGLLSNLHRAAFLPQGDKAWSAEDVRQLVESPGVIVMVGRDGDMLAGFILFRLVCGEAEMITLAVSPACREAGWGSLLLDAAIGHLVRGRAEKFFLEVREDNLVAQSLYRKKGFEETGRRKHYYQTQSGRRIDALCFTLILPEQNRSK